MDEADYERCLIAQAGMVAQIVEQRLTRTDHQYAAHEGCLSGAMIRPGLPSPLRGEPETVRHPHEIRE
jgi:hypothetical protein